MQYLVSTSQFRVAVFYLGLDKVPSNDSDFESGWRNELLTAVLTKYRVADENLREQFNNKCIFICQEHTRVGWVSQFDILHIFRPNDTFTFRIRYFAWILVNNQDIYNQFFSFLFKIKLFQILSKF